MEIKGTIFEGGYGLIPKKVMRDQAISINAKALYAYLCAYAGVTGEAFPTIDQIKRELHIGKNKYYRLINELINAGYIEIRQNKTAGNKFANNVYRLKPYP